MTYIMLFMIRVAMTIVEIIVAAIVAAMEIILR